MSIAVYPLAALLSETTSRYDCSLFEGCAVRWQFKIFKKREVNKQ
jgi:hypothetical protein